MDLLVQEAGPPPIEGIEHDRDVAEAWFRVLRRVLDELFSGHEEHDVIDVCGFGEENEHDRLTVGALKAALLRKLIYLFMKERTDMQSLFCIPVGVSPHSREPIVSGPLTESAPKSD